MTTRDQVEAWHAAGDIDAMRDALLSMREAMVAHRGDTLALRIPKGASAEELEAVHRSLKVISADFGVNFVLLPDGYEVIREGEPT